VDSGDGVVVEGVEVDGQGVEEVEGTFCTCSEVGYGRKEVLGQVGSCCLVLGEAGEE